MQKAFNFQKEYMSLISRTKEYEQFVSKLNEQNYNMKTEQSQLISCETLVQSAEWKQSINELVTYGDQFLEIDKEWSQLKYQEYQQQKDMLSAVQSYNQEKYLEILRFEAQIVEETYKKNILDASICQQQRFLDQLWQEKTQIQQQLAQHIECQNVYQFPEEIDQRIYQIFIKNDQNQSEEAVEEKLKLLNEKQYENIQYILNCKLLNNLSRVKTLEKDIEDQNIQYKALQNHYEINRNVKLSQYFKNSLEPSVEQLLKQEGIYTIRIEELKDQLEMKEMSEKGLLDNFHDIIEMKAEEDVNAITNKIIEKVTAKKVLLKKLADLRLNHMTEQAQRKIEQLFQDAFKLQQELNEEQNKIGLEF